MEMLIHGTDSLFCSWYVYYKNQYMDTLEELFDVHKSVWESNAERFKRSQRQKHRTGGPKLVGWEKRGGCSRDGVGRKG